MPNSPAFVAAVTVLRSYLRSSDQQPLQLTAIDLAHFVTQLPLRMGSPVEREVYIRLMTTFHDTERALEKRELGAPQRALLIRELEEILLHPSLFSSGLQLVAACLYWHYLPQGEKR